MMVILLNCVTLGMYQPCMDDKCTTNRCKILQIFDDFIFAFFSLEMTIKMVAMGVYGRGSYLADSWNRLDMFIVLAGALEYSLAENMNLSAIRTIRVLRPLRAINRIPSMRILVMLLLDTLPMLGNVLLLCFFVFFIFGIVGVQLWQGILRQRCYLQHLENVTYPKDLSGYYTFSQEQEYICSQNDHSGMHMCGHFPPYKHGELVCNGTAIPGLPNRPTNTTCVNWNQYYTECRNSSDNPFQGTISFDNIGLAWVAIFLVISLEGWTDIMYYVQDAHSFWDWIYFVLLIVIGSFFMINLCLVVIATQFSETKKREMERMRLERARFQSTSTLASSTNNSEPTTCYAEIVKYIAHLWRRGKRRLVKKLRLMRYRRDERNQKSAGETIRLNCNRRHHPCCPRFRQTPPNSGSLVVSSSCGTSEAAPRGDSRTDDDASQRRPGVLRVPSPQAQDPIEPCPMQLLSPPTASSTRRRSSVMFKDVVMLHGDDDLPSVSGTANPIGKRNVCSSEKMTQTEDGNIWQIPTSQQILQTQQQIANECNELTNGEAMTCQELLALSGALSAALPTGQIALDSFFSSLAKGNNTRQGAGGEDIFIQQWSDDDYSCCQDMWHCEAEFKNAKRSKVYVLCCTILKGIVRGYCIIRKYVRILVEHKYFQQGILLAIFVNTMSMGIEYHDQPEQLTAIVEVSNIVFSAIFAVEMVLKVIAEGPFGYVANGFNVFDGIIVVLSAAEICQKYYGDPTGDSGLSVLRTFRLLRILKLVRFMPNLRRQLFVMLRTMDNVAVFFSLLILFIFIFSILGMYLFGGKFCKFSDGDNPARDCTCQEIVTSHRLCECDRKHFNNFLWATVTVFQILTQEDWNMVLSNGMAKTSHWAALYFVALMTFGNYVLFNLLVAILVEGFSSERNERREREQRELAKKRMSMIEASSDRGISDESSRSVTSSSDSYVQDTKNAWRSAEELRKLKDSNGTVACRQCDGCDRSLSRTCRECCQRNSTVQLNLEPKCNIQKHMLRHPVQRQSPPIITHTAATPQDSPCTTLEDFPEFKFSVSAGDCTPTIGSIAGGLDTIYRSSSTSIPGLLKPPTLTPPPLTFRQFEKPPNKFQLEKINIPPERSYPKTSTLSEKVNVSLEKSDKEQNPDKCKVQRGYSWKLSRPSIRKKKNRSGSDSDAILVLNNGRDHSQCNGGGVTRHASLRNNSLLQSSIRIQNDTQGDTPNNRNVSKGLSPQNSLRSRSSTYSSVPQVAWGPSITRQNSLTASHVSAQSKISPCNAELSRYRRQHDQQQQPEEKPLNNMNDKVIAVEGSLPKINCDENGSQTGSAEQPMSELRRLLYFLQPKGCMKERDDFSLYLFPPNNRFRHICQKLVGQKWFDNVVLLFIALNCITLAMERPNIPPNSPERLFLATANYVFTVVFAAEMFVKVVAAGMCYGPDAYFTSGWNIMDGALVIISIIDLLMSLISESSPRIFGILRVFRLLRSLRPLRVINRAPGLKLVVQTLLSSLRPIGNIVLICCTFFIIFGILGVQLFKGSFYYCKGDWSKGVRNRTECEAHKGNEWVNQKYNFDDLGKALMSLFVLSSRDGWVNIMYTGLDAVGENQQPIVNYSEWRLLYFISFILLVGFFVLNMFVGVVVENFHRCREEQEKEERIRRAAKRALQMEKRRRKMHEPPYYEKYSRTRLFIHNVVTSKYFDLAIAGVIGLNVVTMATEHWRMGGSLEYALKIFNYFFTAVFILESVMKLIALGVLLYLKDKWNQLDVCIVILSIVGIVLEELKSNIIPINPTVLRVMRVLRIARVLKLLKMAKGIRALLDTVMQALPQVGNLGLLFFLLFFIFAALGVELFGRLECSDEFPCQGLGEHAHFSNFGMAFLTLFRVATGDNWNGIMKDTLRDDCDDAADCVRNCCVSTIIAPIFFVIFVLMAQFVLVNVVVAVLMKHLEESHKHLEDEQDMDTQLEREFQERQDFEESRELCLALQLDSECMQPLHKPLTKVLSLPSNFTYNPPGSRRSSNASGRRPSIISQSRRQTLHSQQPIMLCANLDDIKNIDESTTDIYSIRESSSTMPSYINKNDANEKNKISMQQINTNLDEIISLNQHTEFLRVSIEATGSKKLTPKKLNVDDAESSKTLLSIPLQQKPMHKLYGSTKHLFRQKSVDVEESPFLLTTTNALLVPDAKKDNSVHSGGSSDQKTELKIPKHDSQESVHRIITERRKLDENLKDINQYDIFEVSNNSTNNSEENLVEKDNTEQQATVVNVEMTKDAADESQC